MTVDMSTAQLARRGCRLLFAAAVLGAAVLCAASPQTQAPAPQSHTDHELSREEATALVQKRYGARVVRADIADQDGRRLYVFRLLSSASKVWIVRVDARTGAEVP
jgi:uncharacterized membrane protein YkoI